jgi:SH3-like domain-containing protein
MRLNYKISLAFFLVFFSSVGVAFPATFTVFTGQVNSEGINLRVDATTGAALICTLTKGELVEVVGEAYDWYKIRLPNEAPAYVKKNLVECIHLDATPNFGECHSAKVIKDRINVRLGPNESSWILGKIDKLTVVNVLGHEGDWYKITPVYQSYGWVNKKFVSRDLTIPKVEKKPVLVANQANPPGSLVIEGKIMPYGVVLWRKATHKLVTPLNKIYFLTGDRKGLDSLNYQKVRVTGTLISPADSKYPIVQADIIEALN